MIYVFDTTSWQQLFGCYSRCRFPTLWKLFDELVALHRVTSIEQVMNEIERRDKKNGELEWARENPDVFPVLSHIDSLLLGEIYKEPRFRHVVSIDQRDAQAPADPYLIARANAIGGMVITQERERGNRVRIPSICRHFDIKCGSLDDFMERENWSF